MTYFRPEIEAMAGYVPGEQPQGGKIIKLNTNENPYPASPAVARAITAALEQGLVKYREDVVVGVENAPEAFLGLFSGSNFGKLIVQVAEKS